jgi:2-keto-4-pentenoate hydratase
MIKSLIEARSSGNLLSTEMMANDGFYSLTEEQGFQYQQSIRKELTVSELFGEQVGWKCGATNALAQSSLGTTSPFYGPLFSHHIFTSNKAVRVSDYGSLIAVEAEYCIRLKRSCPPKATTYSLEEILSAIDSFSPAIEIATTRLAGKYSAGAIIADFAWNGCVVLGHRVPIEHVVIESLNESEASLSDEAGVTIAQSKASNVLGGPVLSLLWLANTLIDAGEYLKEGDVVMTGAACVCKTFEVGTRVTATFQGVVHAQYGTPTVEVSSCE